MSSILTNTSAITAVANLAATQKSLSETENEISTGLKVSSAKDNAAYYSIATTLRTQVGNLSAVSDSLNLGSSVVATSTAAVNNVTSILQSIQKDLVSASQPGTDLTSLQTSITTLRSQLGNTISTASFNGVNLLDGSNTQAVQFVGGVTGSGAGTVVNTLSVDTTATNLSGATYVSGSNALAKTAEVADAGAATAKSANDAALNTLTAAISGLSAGDLADATSSTSTAAFKAVFGNSAAISGGVVSGISASSTAGAVLGGTATSGITITVATKAIASYTNGTATVGTLAGYLGTGATNTTTAATAAGGAAHTQNLAHAALDATATSAYLVDTAAAAATANTAASSAFATAKTSFQDSVASLSASDLASGSTTTAFQAVFGANAVSNGTTVTGISSNSLAGSLLGTGGSYTIATGAFTTSGTDATTGGALFSLYGSGSTNATTDSTATAGAAFAAKTATAAVNNNTAASSVYNGALFSISQINLVGASKDQIAAYVSQVGAALSSVNTASESLGAASTNIDLQSTYTSALSDSLTTGVGSLVDADLNEASTRLNALQTQQQLGVQALSVANQDSQLILKLFQG